MAKNVYFNIRKILDIFCKIKYVFTENKILYKQIKKVNEERLCIRA